MPEAKMIARRRVLLAMGGLVGASAFVRHARAAQLEFTPITIDASQGAFATSIDVVNRGGGASMLQVRAFSWQQLLDGSDPLVRSDAIVISPPMFTLPEGETQTMRVVLHTESTAIEQAFRILVDEIPQARVSAVQLALRVSLPVFAAPDRAKPDLHWRVTPGDAGQLLLSAQNRGTRHTRIARTALTTLGHAPVEGKLESQLPYVLAGSTRRWTVPFAGVRPGSEVHLTADMDGKSVAMSLPVET